MDDLKKLRQSVTLNTDCISMSQVVGGNAHLAYYAVASNTQMGSVANALGCDAEISLSTPHASASTSPTATPASKPPDTCLSGPDLSTKDGSVPPANKAK